MMEEKELAKYLKKNLANYEIVNLWNYYDWKDGQNYQIEDNHLNTWDNSVVEELYNEADCFSNFINQLNIDIPFEKREKLEEIFNLKPDWNVFLEKAKCKTLNDLEDSEYVYFKPIYDWRLLTPIKDIYEVVDLSMLSSCLLNENNLSNVLESCCIEDEIADELGNVIQEKQEI